MIDGSQKTIKSGNPAEGKIKAMCKATKKADAYSITKDAKTKAFNISFNGVYSNEIRKLMFDNHFRWSKTNACFYGWTKDILSLSSQIQKLVYDWRNVDIKSKFIECPLILENDIQTIEVYKNKKDYVLACSAARDNVVTLKLDDIMDIEEPETAKPIETKPAANAIENFDANRCEELLQKYHASYTTGHDGIYNDCRGSNEDSELLRDGRKFKKFISDTLKSEIPGLKFEMTCNFRGWYDKVNLTLKVNKADFFKSYADIQRGEVFSNNWSAFEEMRYSLARMYNHGWTTYSQTLGQLIYEEYFMNQDYPACRYQKAIKDNYAEIIRFIDSLLKSFTYDQSSIQTDYFDSGLSYHIDIEIMDKDIEAAQRFKDIFNDATPNNEIEILKHYPDFKMSEDVKKAVEEQIQKEKDYLEQQRLEEELRKQEEEKREKEWFAGLVEEFGERSANFIKGFLTIFEGSLHFNIDLELNYSKPGDEKELIAKAIAKKIAGYNDWTPEKFNKIFEIMNRYSIAQYGEDNPNNGKRNWTMRFGRESSIVTYLDASFNDEETANKCYKEIESMIHPDELSIESSFPMFANNIHKTFRLWWD